MAPIWLFGEIAQAGRIPLSVNIARLAEPSWWQFVTSPSAAFKQENDMYGWAITLAIVALIAAILGFGGVAGVLADIALVVFIIALIATIIFFVMGWKAGKKLSSKL
ncbi:DUF1328 domain-containing protein [Parasphingorhabdus sp.]|uniref:DUF1328 domain-containing protein n=1 Tax=Parasphingorhabdus sp. TaxID=2709688 RepID=UPI003593C410